MLFFEDVKKIVFHTFLPGSCCHSVESIIVQKYLDDRTKGPFTPGRDYNQRQGQMCGKTTDSQSYY